MLASWSTVQFLVERNRVTERHCTIKPVRKRPIDCGSRPSSGRLLPKLGKKKGGRTTQMRRRRRNWIKTRERARRWKTTQKVFWHRCVTSRSVEGLTFEECSLNRWSALTVWLRRDNCGQQLKKEDAHDDDTQTVSSEISKRFRHDTPISRRTICKSKVSPKVSVTKSEQVMKWHHFRTRRLYLHMDMPQVSKGSRHGDEVVSREVIHDVTDCR